jgi:hypothetical protein
MASNAALKEKQSRRSSRHNAPMSRSSKKTANEDTGRRKHARQPSEVSFTGDYEGDMRAISRLLDRIPADFRDSENFNPLDVVIDIMKSESLEARKQDLETDCRSMESAMETIVAGTCLFAVYPFLRWRIAGQTCCFFFFFFFFIFFFLVFFSYTRGI